jgi:hypothetical protein
MRRRSSTVLAGFDLCQYRCDAESHIILHWLIGEIVVRATALSRNAGR